jgi:hypothetical protein
MRKDMPEDKEAQTIYGAIPGAEERELTDEELLGEATLAKISFQVRPIGFEDEEVLEEIVTEDEAEDLEAIDLVEEEAELEAIDLVEEEAELEAFDLEVKESEEETDTQEDKG